MLCTPHDLSMHPVLDFAHESLDCVPEPHMSSLLVRLHHGVNLLSVLTPMMFVISHPGSHMPVDPSGWTTLKEAKDRNFSTAVKVQHQDITPLRFNPLHCPQCFTCSHIRKFMMALRRLDVAVVLADSA